MPSSAVAAKTTAPAHLTGLSFSQSDLNAMKSGVLSHLDMQLAAIYQSQHADGRTAPGMFANTTSMGAAVHTGGRFVTIDVTVRDTNGNGHIDASESAAVLSQLQGIGLTHGSTYAGIVSGTLSVGQVGALADTLNSHDLGFARVSSVQTNFGSVDSQADPAQHGHEARSHFGVNGAGVGVGVLSDSFDARPHAHDHLGNPDHMADDIASHDLPFNTSIFQDIAHGTDEGRGMGQLVHDIAPGASIEFATAFTGQAGFANNIVQLAVDGNQVITDDVIYFFELAYQEGPIAQAINFAANNYGVSYFSSAGNNGHEGLQEAWVDGGPGYFGETLMQFSPGIDYLPVVLSSREIFILQWDEPGASAGGDGSASDVDLFLTNQDGSVVYAISADFNEGGDPIEGFGISGGAGGTYYLRVGLFSGPAPTEIKIVALGNGAPVDLGTTATNINNGTMYGHAAAEHANAVGAVRFDATQEWGVNPPDSESFTSAGPTRIWYDNAGNRLAAPDDRQVDFSAVDGSNTTFFGGGDYDGDGFPNFFGTSAAAPDAAAVAALMVQANGALNPTDISNLLFDSAIDMDNGNVGGTVGFDNGPDAETGAGFIQADLAVGFAVSLHIENEDAVVLKGTHFGDVIEGNGNANTIYGGDGGDEIHGGIRGDTLYGGNGADSFVYDTQYDSVHLVRFDTIGDLDDSLDTIDLSALDANASVAGDQAFTLVAGFGTGYAELQVKYHAGGIYHGKTTIKGWTNGDHDADLFIVVNGDHSAYTGFDL